MPTKEAAPGLPAKPASRVAVPLGTPAPAPVYPTPAAGKYATPAAVAAAHKAGKLSYDQAAAILKRDFGIQ